ncbi:MAG: hypothetical protein WDA26_04795 [Pusillimonas sp.]
MNIIEIFRPGKFKAMNGKEIEFSSAMLQDIADIYNPSVSQAPLVIGHPKVEDPAYGWVKNLSFADGKLKAEPESVVEEFAGIVSAGLYKNVSASFFAPDHPANPAPGKYYLKHVGFLGATPPAVSGLKAVSFASGDEQEICFEFSAAPQNTKENDMKTNEFADKERKLLEREKAIAAKEAELKKAEFAAFVDELKKDGKIIPAQVSGLVEFAMGLDSDKTLDFAGDKKTQTDFFKSFLKNQPKVVNFGEFAPDSTTAEVKLSPVQIAEKAEGLRNRLKDEGLLISYADAVVRVSGGEK